MTEKTSNSPPELSLVKRIRAGEQAAENELITAYRERVSFVMLARTADAQATPDLVQDVLMSVLLAVRNGQVQKPESLGAFVYGTTRNVASNHLRDRRREPGMIPIHAGLESPNPPDGAVISERRNLLLQSLKRLNPTDRKILLLTLVEGLKPGEIAKRLGLRPEALRKRKSRAIQKVMKSIKKKSQK